MTHKDKIGSAGFILENELVKTNSLTAEDGRKSADRLDDERREPCVSEKKTTVVLLSGVPGKAAFLPNGCRYRKFYGHRL